MSIELVVELWVIAGIVIMELVMPTFLRTNSIPASTTDLRIVYVIMIILSPIIIMWSFLCWLVKLKRKS